METEGAHFSNWLALNLDLSLAIRLTACLIKWMMRFQDYIIEPFTPTTEWYWSAVASYIYPEVLSHQNGTIST